MLLKKLLSLFKRPVYVYYGNYRYDINKQIFLYKRKEYKIVKVVKGKCNGNNEWVDCVIYQALYLKTDNQFVRTKEQFFKLFIPKIQ